MSWQPAPSLDALEARRETCDSRLKREAKYSDTLAYTKTPTGNRRMELHEGLAIAGTVADFQKIWSDVFVVHDVNGKPVCTHRPSARQGKNYRADPETRGMQPSWRIR